MEFVIILAWIVIPIIFIAICGKMAKTRNRSVVLWCVLGLFLGLVAVIILAILGPADRHPVKVDADDFS